MRCSKLTLGVMLLVGTTLTGSNFTPAQKRTNHSSAIQFITATELKDKLARNERVTIIDVRATSGYVESADKIKGAIHVKLRLE